MIELKGMTQTANVGRPGRTISITFSADARGRKALAKMLIQMVDACDDPVMVVGIEAIADELGEGT